MNIPETSQLEIFFRNRSIKQVFLLCQHSYVDAMRSLADKLRYSTFETVLRLKPIFKGDEASSPEYIRQTQLVSFSVINLEQAGYGAPNGGEA